MKKYYVTDAINKIGEVVELYGWVHNIRDHKNIIFVDLRDKSGIIQLVGNISFKKLSPEDVIYIKGVVKKRPENMINKKIKSGHVEIEVKKMEIISESSTLPIDLSKQDLNVSLPTLLDYRSLTLRHPKIKSIFKIQETIIDEFRKTLNSDGFIEFQAPIIVPAQAEGGAAVFPVSYFNKKTYLAQSPQLYKQIMLGVFEI